VKKICFCLLIFFLIGGRLLSQKPETGELHKKYIDPELPGIVPKVFAPNFISTEEGHEFSCCFSPNGKEFYFVRDRKLMFTKYENNEWIKPGEVEICKGYFCKEPHITGDNKILYFGSKQIEDGKVKNGIWKAERKVDGWSDPVFIGEGTFLSSTINGEVYFGYDDGTHQSNKIIKAKVVDDKFCEQQVVFTSDDFPSSGHFSIMHPYVSPDETIIIFSAYRKGEWGKQCDLFACFKENNGNWGKPIMFDKSINAGLTMTPALSHDGKYLFFLRDGDMWWVDAKVLNEMKPN